MLVPSIFSFSHNVFYPSQNKFQFVIHLSCHLQMLSIWTSLKIIMSFGKELKNLKIRHRFFVRSESGDVSGTKFYQHKIPTLPGTLSSGTKYIKPRISAVGLFFLCYRPLSTFFFFNFIMATSPPYSPCMLSSSIFYK